MAVELQTGEILVTTISVYEYGKFSGHGSLGCNTPPCTRYAGTDCALMCPPNTSSPLCSKGDYISSFEARYRTEFGFTLPER